MATQELLLFDAAPSLLGESSGSFFDCMDSEAGVDDLLCGSRDLEQVSSPAPSQLMRPLTEGKTCIGSGSWEAVPSIGFNRLSEPAELPGPIRCMAHELELQARRLEEQHALQSSEGLSCEPVRPFAAYQTIALRPVSTGPQSTTTGSYSSAATMMKIPSKGDTKPKPKRNVSSVATVSLAVKNSQGVSAGTGCLQPGAWRGCLKSSWCNRENRHRGLCNSRATIPGVDAYNQPAVPTVEPHQLVADNLVEQTVQTPVDILTPCEAHCQLDNDSEPGSCSDLDTYSVYPGSDPPPMVQQQELQPLVPCSSTSSDMGGRLSSLDLSQKLEQQWDQDSIDQTADTNAFLASAIQYNSGTDYSDEEEEEDVEVNDSDDADSICSGSTLSADEQDSMVSDLVDSGGCEEMYSDGPQISSGGSGGPIRKQRSHGGRCVNAGFPGQACTQCYAQQTPVWRAGPMGPKTLCNACGVRWMKNSKRK